MKFVNGTQADKRCFQDSSKCAYGRIKNASIPPPPPVVPSFPNINSDLSALFKTLTIDNKQTFESKMLKASKIQTVDSIRKETEDILAVLRNLHKK